MFSYPIISKIACRLPAGDKSKLADFMDAVTHMLEEAGEAVSLQVDCNIILDELITNISMHGYKDAPTKPVPCIRVYVIVSRTHLLIRMRDHGTAFNPLERQTVLPTSDNIDDLTLGGLGIFMALERIDESYYNYRQKQNVLSLIKKLPHKFFDNEYTQRARTINQDNEELLQKYMQDGQLTSQNIDWNDYHQLSSRLVLQQQDNHYQQHFVPLNVPLDLQRGAYKNGKDYSLNIQACTWGEKHKPPLICIGGILNTAERFVVLARVLAQDYFVISLSWAGRGKSEWLMEQDDYYLDVYTAHIDAVVNYFGLSQIWILGSSLGGAAAIQYAADKADEADEADEFGAQSPKVLGLILNDTGSRLEAKRRARRATSVGRHHVFKTPQELLRRYELANRAEAYIPESFLLLYAFWQTRAQTDVSGEEQRIYNHDYRALLSYRRDARHDLDLRHQWQKLKLPILLLHGTVSTALLRKTCDEMLEQKQNLRLVEISHVGHTPPLTDPQTIGAIGGWLQNRQQNQEPIARKHRIKPQNYERKNIFVFNQATKANAAITEHPTVTEFYMLRHGSTQFNQQKIRCGREHDIPLSRKGIEEIIRIGLYLRDHTHANKDKEFSAIYCGGLQRLLKSAYIINNISGIETLYCDDRLDERSIGDFSGRPICENEEQLQRGDMPKNAETEVNFQNRVHAVLDAIIYRATICPIVVTSRGVMKRIIMKLTSIDDEVKKRNVVYHFQYQHASQKWHMQIIDTQKIAFDKSDFSKFLDTPSLD